MFFSGELLTAACFCVLWNRRGLWIRKQRCRWIGNLGYLLRHGSSRETCFTLERLGDISWFVGGGLVARWIVRQTPNTSHIVNIVMEKGFFTFLAGFLDVEWCWFGSWRCSRLENCLDALSIWNIEVNNRTRRSLTLQFDPTRLLWNGLSAQKYIYIYM